MDEKDNRRKIAELSRRPYDALEGLLKNLRGRILAAFLLITMGVVTAMYPSFSALQSLAAWGISPKLIALSFVLCGGIILRWPDGRLYYFCLAPFILYTGGVIDYYSTRLPGSSPTPVIICVFLILYLFAAGVDDGPNH